MGKVMSKGPCSFCGSSDAAALYEDGGIKCHSCGKSSTRGDFSKNKYQTSSTNKTPRKKLNDIKVMPIADLSSRSISKETCDKYRVRSQFNTETGEQDKFYFPYTNDQNELVAYKGKDTDKNMFWTGRSKESLLFGSFLRPNGGRFAIVTEGEEDAMAAYQMCRERHKEYTCLSIPGGATLSDDSKGVIDPSLRRCYEYLCSFDKLLLCFDSDSPGRAMASAVADWLCSDVQISIATLPLKDANEMLKEGRQDEFFSAINEAKKYQPEKVKEYDSEMFDWLWTPIDAGLELPFPRLNMMLGGLRAGELTLITAGTGTGKSTMCRQIAQYLRERHSIKIANIFLEEQMKKTMQAYVALDLKIPLHKLRLNPGMVTPDQLRDSTDRMLNQTGTYFLDHTGSLKNEELISKCNYLVKACGCELIILDHISLVISGIESNNERKDIDVLMTSLASLCEMTGVRILAVVHLKRAEGRRVVKDDEGNINREIAPFNRGGVISLSDLRGSAGLEQLSWNIIALERDQFPDDEADGNKAWARVLKNREIGVLGLADDFYYHPETGLYEVYR